jgi:ankyrin repeat protein
VLLETALPLVIVLLGELMGVTALMRNEVAYAIGLPLLLAAPALYGSRTGTVLIAFVMTPSAEMVQAGHGFTRPADRALANAIVARDAAKVASLAPAANLNAPGWDNKTFVRLALENGADHGVVVALLSAGADADREVFDAAISHKDLQLLRAMIEAGVDMSNRGERWNPRLFATLDWPEGLSLILEHGGNTEAEDREGYTAMMWAVYSERWPAVDILLVHGARIDDVTHRTSQRGTTLRSIVLAKTKQMDERHSEIPPQLAAVAARFSQ